MNTFCNDPVGYAPPGDIFAEPGPKEISALRNDRRLGRMNLSSTSGLDEMGNRAADLSDLGLSIGLDRQNDFFDLANANIGADARLRDMNDGLAQDMEYSRREIYDPLEADIVSEARSYDSPDRTNQEMGRADAAVVQAYDKAARTGDRSQLRLGVNPNSGKAMAARENLNFDRAMASATAGNRAADNLKSKGFGMRMTAAGLGRDKAAQQIAAANSSMGIGQGSINSMGQAMDSNRDVFSGANNSLNTAASAFSRTAQINSDAANNRDRMNEASDARDDQMTGNLLGAGLGWLGGKC